MRCKNIELLILEAKERKLTQTEIRAIEQHLAQCAACTTFKNDLAKLRNGFNHICLPTPSSELVEKTQILCQQQLNEKQLSPSGFGFRLRRIPVPKFIWISIPVIMGITTYLLLPGLQDLAAQSRSFEAMAVLTIILQNAALLVLAPILIKNLRRRQNTMSWSH